MGLLLLCRRVAAGAAAAVRQQLNLLPSTALHGRQQQQQQGLQLPRLPAAAHIPVVTAGGAVTATAAADMMPVLALPLLSQHVMGVAWGGDRRKLKNDQLRAEKQQTAEEKARERAEMRAAYEEQKEKQKQQRAQQKAEREAERKAVEAAKRAEAKKERVCNKCLHVCPVVLCCNNTGW